MPPTATGAAYLAEHNVDEVLKKLLAAILEDRPADPVATLAERLLSHSREKKSSSPSSNPHVEHFSGAASSTNPHMAFAKFGAVPATASASAAQSLQYEGNNFDGAVLGGRPKPPSDLGSGARAMADAVATPATPQPTRTKCEILLLISSAAGYERRRKVIRSTYLAALKASPALASRVQYRFLLGAPKPEQAAVLAAEQAEHGDLLQVGVTESYETLFPKVVAAWRWAVSTHDFGFWMHADDDAYIRLDLLLGWLDHAPAAQPHRGLYAGYIWDGSDGRRTKPLRDPTAKSYMPVEQWPHDSYPPFASVSARARVLTPVQQPRVRARLLYLHRARLSRGGIS